MILFGVITHYQSRRFHVVYRELVARPRYLGRLGIRLVKLGYHLRSGGCELCCEGSMSKKICMLVSL